MKLISERRLQLAYLRPIYWKKVMTDLVVEVGKVLLDSLLIWFRKLTRKTLLTSIHK